MVEHSELPEFRVGLIGAGEVVRTIHLPILQQMSAVKIKWVMDANPAKARTLAENHRISRWHSCLEHCDGVDGVLIAIPIGARLDSWQRAFDARWHVLCEKPVARTPAELDWILAGMHRNLKVLQPGLMRRFYASTLLARSLVESGIFGELREIWAGEGGQMTRTGRSTGWYQLDRSVAGGGILIETGSHLLDQMMFISRAAEAFVDDYQQVPEDGAMEFKARVEGRLAMAGRLEIPFTCALSRSDDLCNGIFLRFPHLMIHIEHGPDGNVHLCDSHGTPVSSLSTVGRGARNSAQAFHAEWASFLGKCAAGEDLIRDPDLSLTRLSVKVIDSCYGLQR